MDMYRIVRYTRSMTQKHATSIRLTAEAKRLLKELAQRSGVSQGAILELLIRQEAARLVRTPAKDP